MKNIASFWFRILGFLIDWLIHMLLLLALILWVSTSSTMEEATNRFLTFLIIDFFYSIGFAFFNPYLISRFGGTIGKLLTGTRIVNPEGKKVNFYRAFFRNHIGYMISASLFWIGFIWILIDKERRSWHDQIANTYVVKVNKTMFIVGIAALAILLGTYGYLVNSTVKNFSANSGIYMNFLKSIETKPQQTKTPTTEQLKLKSSPVKVQ